MLLRKTVVRKHFDLLITSFDQQQLLITFYANHFSTVINELIYHFSDIILFLHVQHHFSIGLVFSVTAAHLAVTTETHITLQ